MLTQSGKIRVAVIGMGGWGPNLVRVIRQDPRVRLSGIAEISPIRLSELKSLYDGSGVIVTSDWQSLVSDAAIDAVLIATPASTHFEVALKALSARKHVFVEKPMATKLSHAIALKELAVKQCCRLMVGHIFLYHPAVHELRKLISDGNLGRLRLFKSHRANLGPVREDVGVLWDLLTHDVSILFYLLKNRPSIVSGRSWHSRGNPLENAVQVMLEFSGGIRAELRASWKARERVRCFTVKGSEGVAVFWDGAKPTIDLAYVSRNRTTTLAPTGGEPLSVELRSFFDWVLGANAPVSNADFGSEVVAILEDIQNIVKKNRSDWAQDPFRARVDVSRDERGNHADLTVP